MELKRAKKLNGAIAIPGDKSISHRAIMFGAISQGTTEVTNFLQGADCLSTISCFKKMGIEIENNESQVIVHGKGLHGLKKPSSPLDVGNSGTTTRLLSGILAGQPFSSTLDGDASIRQRPMKRIISPLTLMGADISSKKGNNCAPLIFHPSSLKGIRYDSPVASAQVKSCILLAGLYAEGGTSIKEPAPSRNHTELMLRAFGAKVISGDATAGVLPNPKLQGQHIQVPGDISSAAYFIAAGLLLPNSEILIKNVGVNPTRDGILKAAYAMGAKIKKENERTVSGEPVCDLFVSSSQLKGTEIAGDMIPTLIDEIPILAVMAAFAKGTTVIRDAEELKVKESNRIDTVTVNLKRMGANVTATKDGMIIEGGTHLHCAGFDSYLDHRIAMSFAVAALALDGPSTMKNGECVNISYPTFYQDLYDLAE